MHFSKKEQIQDQELNEIIGAFNENIRKNYPKRFYSGYDTIKIIRIH